MAPMVAVVQADIEEIDEQLSVRDYALVCYRIQIYFKSCIS